MPIFKKTALDEQKFAEHIGRINTAIDTLSPYGDYTDLSQLAKIRDSFITKTDDFFREDRKLNIGVIGQVKAGKSSFLNTLLFGGKKVLPSAATPKTATLTKIEYSEENLSLMLESCYTESGFSAENLINLLS
ncbi:MAG: dynamin family protein [Oscillospiraceae bacterium]|nr:dynamin family protein [Oscillospiraceae bacterium]